MKIEDIFLRRVWLIEYIQDHPGVSRKRLFEDWCRSYLSDFGELTFSRSTFCTEIEMIEKMFNIHIKYIQEGSQGGYYIVPSKSVYSYKLHQWMLGMMKTGLTVSKCIHLHDRFIIDDFPSEGGMLAPIVSAIEGNRKLRLIYHRYGKHPARRTISPYCIKTFKNRIYVLGRFDSGRICIFSLDRIEDIDILDDTFEVDESFDARDFFAHCYGVFLPDEDAKIETVMFRSYGDAKYYYRDVPLHRSQREIFDCEEYADFEVTLFVTNDFIGDIIQQAGRLEILSPAHLRSRVADIICNMASQYAETPVLVV